MIKKEDLIRYIKVKYGACKKKDVITKHRKTAYLYIDGGIMAYRLEKEDLIKESCFIEARNVTNDIAKLVNLMIDSSKGVPVEDQIEHEMNSLTYDNLKLKKCILRESTMKLTDEELMKLPKEERISIARRIWGI